MLAGTQICHLRLGISFELVMTEPLAHTSSRKLRVLA
jgi:hypothetical protein